MVISLWGFVSGHALISIFVCVCILQIPPSHHVSSPNVNGSLNNHQEQSNRPSPEGTSSPLHISEFDNPTKLANSWPHVDTNEIPRCCEQTLN